MSEVGKWHYAVLGCCVEDEDGKLYGLTCRHVTRAANGVFCVKRAFGKLIDIGRALKSDQDQQFQHDIDIIEVNQALQAICEAQYKDKGDESIPCRLFNGTIADLYGKDVFLCSVYGKDHDEHPRKYRRGKVCSRDFHVKHSNSINVYHNFVVDGYNGPFSNPGDSGTIVALQDESGCIHLVGVIIAGKFCLKDGNISENCSLCLFLPDGLKMLNCVYKTTLSIRRDTRVGSDGFVRNGSVVWFKTPERIKVVEIDLFERLMTLTCKVLEDSSNDVSLLLNYEIKMSNQVFSREDVKSDDYDFDQADQNCVFSSMLACQYLYENQFNKAMKYLKTACRMVTCNSQFPVRLLCKVISYATWLFLEMNELDKMKDLLDAGLEFMEETRHCKSFPTESIGYQYYDYARYYSKVDDVCEATNMARRAVNYFEKEDRRLDGSPNRLILAVAQFAQIKLGCGEEFEKSSRHVAEDDVDEAEHCLDLVKDVVKVQPPVQLTDYLLSMADLHYRKGQMRPALRCAEQCLDIAEANQLEAEKRWAMLRIRELQDRLPQEQC